MLHGEPGIGKTALLQYAAEPASALSVVRAVGVESEMELAFAALHQLCAPMFDRLDQLPSPQRDALAITFGLRAGAVPDRFLVGVAVSSLLSEAAAERPLLCVVDDAQWLDRASAQVLAFVARRLQAESIVLLLATREPSQDFSRLPELVVKGLRDTDAHELLRSAIPGRLDDQVLDQFVAETGGNPLALLELPRGLTPGDWRAASGCQSRWDCLIGSNRASSSASWPCRRTPADSCWWRRRIRQVIPRCCGGPPGRSASQGPCWNPRRVRGSWTSALAWDFATRWCARRSTGRHRRWSGGRCTERWAMRPMLTTTPTAAPGTARRRAPAPTRRSPPSSSVRPRGRRRAAAQPRRPFVPPPLPAT